MPKQRKRDGVYWRKDRRKYYFSYVDETGQRQREPGSVNHDETVEMLAEAKARVKQNRNLRPGELPVCQETFADVADRYPCLPEAAPQPAGL